MAMGSGCSSGAAERPAEAPKTTTPASFLCPSLDAQNESSLATLFGIDAATAARLDRARRLAIELDATRAALDAQTREACTLIAKDLDATGPLPAAVHPCSVAATRLDALRTKLGGGAKLVLSIGGATCGVPKNAVGRCAGECLTGDARITSHVTCASESGDGLCSGTFTLPDAGPGCAARCTTRALREATCSADIDLRIEGDGGGTAAGDLDALRRDLPRIAGLAIDLAPRAGKLAEDVARVVDDLGASIDALSKGPANVGAERRIAVGASVATCFAPALGAAVRASRGLTETAGELGRVERALARR